MGDVIAIVLSKDTSSLHRGKLTFSYNGVTLTTAAVGGTTTALAATALTNAINAYAGSAIATSDGLATVTIRSTTPVSVGAFATGALPLAYAQLFSMNQLAMLPKAAAVQTQISEHLAAKPTGQALSQAQSQAQAVSDMDFLFPPGDTIKFS